MLCSTLQEKEVETQEKAPPPSSEEVKGHITMAGDKGPSSEITSEEVSPDNS